MNEQWYYSNQGQQGGPVGFGELRQLSATGRLAPEDMVWCDGMPDWAEARNVDGLFGAPANGATAPRNPAVAVAGPSMTGPKQAPPNQSGQSVRMVGASSLPTYQQVRSSGSNKFFVILGAIIVVPIVLLIVVAVIAAIVNPKTKAQLDQAGADAITNATHDAGASTSGSNSSASDAAVSTYTVTQISKAYDDNGLAADAQFKGQKIRVTGVVNDIDSDIMNNPTISMDDGNFISPIFTFDSGSRSQLAQVKKGMQVTLVCTGESDVIKVPQFGDCELVQ